MSNFPIFFRNARLTCFHVPHDGAGADVWTLDLGLPSKSSTSALDLKVCGLLSNSARSLFIPPDWTQKEQKADDFGRNPTSKNKRVINGAKERRSRLQANFSWHQHPRNDTGRLPTCLFSLNLQILKLAVVWCQEEILWDFSCSITKQLVIHSCTLVKWNRCCQHFHSEFEKSWSGSIKSLVTCLVTVQSSAFQMLCSLLVTVKHTVAFLYLFT